MRTRSRSRFSSHVNRARSILQVDAEQTRRRLITELREAFQIAGDYARGRVKYVVDDEGKQRPLNIIERRHGFYLPPKQLKS